MIRTAGAAAFLALLFVGGAGTLAAQDSSELRLEDFVQRVARLWAAGDVGAIVELMPAANRLSLDTGAGIETANSRHAAAALRALFAERETVSTRAVSATLASANPPRGFGELSWTFRTRGVAAEQSRSIYVAVLREQRGWRIYELRVIP